MTTERDGAEGNTSLQCSRRRLVLGLPGPLVALPLLAVASVASESKENSNRDDAAGPDQAYAQRYYNLCRR